MREDYTVCTPEREQYDPTVREELDSLYDEVSTTQPLENDGSTDNK